MATRTAKIAARATDLAKHEAREGLRNAKAHELADDFDEVAGRLQDGRLVYPLATGGTTEDRMASARSWAK